MSDPVIAILQKRKRIVGRNLFFGSGKGGYSGWSKSKNELDQRILDARQAKFGRKAKPISWRLHDRRRTGDTLMNDELGIDPDVVEAILNHVSGSKSGIDRNEVQRYPEDEAGIVKPNPHIPSFSLNGALSPAMYRRQK